MKRQNSSFHPHHDCQQTRQCVPKPLQTQERGKVRDPSAVCEVRVPTYRRPKLLKRALLSILEQTHRNWRCVVFDDCPDGTARCVVDDIRDSRIGYSRNSKQLGAVGNIDQSFVRRPLWDGKYAFVLEDDNYLLPHHIERSIDILNTYKAKVALCNQICEVIDVAGEPGRKGSDLTLNWMYEPGPHDPEDLLPALLFSHGFSNGAAFWSTDCLSDFEIGALTQNAGIQESLRLLRLRDHVYVSLDPTSVWRPGEIRKRSPGGAQFWRSAARKMDLLIMEKQIIDFQCVVLKKLGLDRVRDFVNKNAIPDFANFREERVAKMERSMLLCGYDAKLTRRSLFYRYRLLVTGSMIRLVGSTNHCHET
jgi:glycosyltransferase involved in cell wall biosynthesis